jgi:hypothetical protein
MSQAKQPDRLPEQEVADAVGPDTGAELKRQLSTQSDLAWIYLWFAGLLVVLAVVCECHLVFCHHEPLVDPKLFEGAPVWASVLTQVWLAAIGKVAVPMTCLFLAPRFARVSLEGFRRPGKHLDGGGELIGHTGSILEKALISILSKRP